MLYEITFINLFHISSQAKNKTMKTPNNQIQTARESAQHTPGPWTYNPQPVQHLGFYIQQDGFLPSQRSFIGEVGGGQQSMEEIKANANLISAAPDLLAALEHMLNVLTVNEPYEASAENEAKAAIAKAKGGQSC